MGFFNARFFLPEVRSNHACRFSRVEGESAVNNAVGIGDMSKKNLHPDMNLELTASNFGRLSDLADKNDIALGIANMVGETIGMLAVFAARNYKLDRVVLTGNLTTLAPIRRVFEILEQTFGIHFIIPENAQYGTVIGAALGAI